MRLYFKCFIFLALSIDINAQTASNIRFDGIGDSSTRVLWDASTTFNSSRVRYIATPGDCLITTGYIQSNTSVSEFGGGFTLFDMTQNISGLAPNTSYSVCPEMSIDNGVTFIPAVNSRVLTVCGRPFSTTPSCRTDAANFTDTLPKPPINVPTAWSDPGAHVLTVASDCSDIQAKLNAAVPGDRVILPANYLSPCTTPISLPTAPDAKSFAPSNVSTIDSQITVTAHGFTNNQEVRLSAGAANPNCLPGNVIFLGSTNNQGFNCDIGGGWHKGTKYYVDVIDANHVIILDSPAGLPVVPGFIKFTCNVGASTITFNPTFQTPGGYRDANGGSIATTTKFQVTSTGTPCGGLSFLTDYYLKTTCSATVLAACTSQLSLTPGGGGSAVTITSTGTGTHRIVDQGLGTMYIAPAPPDIGTGQDIVVCVGSAGICSLSIPVPGRSICPNMPFPTCTPLLYDTQMFHLRQATQLSGAMLEAGILSHNWRFVGVTFDTVNTTEYLTTVDPRPFGVLIDTHLDNSNILFDRVRVQGPGFPDRLGATQAIILDGANTGFINSDLRGLDYWHPWFKVGSFCIDSSAGCTSNGSISSTVVHLSPGTFYGGAFTSTTTADTVITLTSGGSITGSALVYFAMDGSMKVLPPTGTTWTCTTTGTTCTVLTAVASPSFPVDGNSRLAAGILAAIQLTSGSIGGTTPYGGTGACSIGPALYSNGCSILASIAVTSPNNTEGTQGIGAGYGPGPYIIDKTFLEGSGILIHFSDAGGPFSTRENYTVSNSTFNVPIEELAGSTQNLATNHGLHYGNRNSLEWKGGSKILVSNNYFLGNFSDVSPASVTLAMTPRQGGITTDVEVINNTFTGNGGLNIPMSVDTQPVSIPFERGRFYNNLFLLDGWTYSVNGGGGIGRGWALYSGYGQEDILIDHNTMYDPRGVTPAFLTNVYWPIGGEIITNNIMFYNGNSAMFTNITQGSSYVPSFCDGLNDLIGMNCTFTAGPGNSSYTFENNVIVPSWSNTQTPSGVVSAASISTALVACLTTGCPSAGTANFLPSPGGSPTAPGYVSFMAFSILHSLSPSSPYYGSCSGRPCGYINSGAKSSISGKIRLSGAVKIE